MRFRWLYLVAVLEFQSTNGARGAAQLLDRKELGPPGHWRSVLPVVLYNGDASWTAALEMRDLIATVPAVLSSRQDPKRSRFSRRETRGRADGLP